MKKQINLLNIIKSKHINLIVKKTHIILHQKKVINLF